MLTWIQYYHSKDLVHDNLCNNQCFAKFFKFGIGYETGGGAIREVSGKLDSIRSIFIVNETADNNECKKYIHNNCGSNMKLVENGMLSTVANALAKHFSESAANVETFFVTASSLGFTHWYWCLSWAGRWWSNEVEALGGHTKMIIKLKYYSQLDEQSHVK